MENLSSNLIQELLRHFLSSYLKKFSISKNLKITLRILQNSSSETTPLKSYSLSGLKNAERRFQRCFYEINHLLSIKKSLSTLTNVSVGASDLLVNWLESNEIFHGRFFVPSSWISSTKVDTIIEDEKSLLSETFPIFLCNQLIYYKCFGENDSGVGHWKESIF